MKEFTKIAAILAVLAVSLVCASCSNNSDSNGNYKKALSTWVGSGWAAGYVSTFYSDNTCKVICADDGIWYEGAIAGDIDAASGKIKLLITKASDSASINGVKVGDVFTYEKTSATTLKMTEPDYNITFTKQ